jgi:hypothetical protein
LGLLAGADFDLEAPARPIASGARIRDDQIPETIAAIEAFERLMFDRVSEPRVAPFTELHAALAWPAMPRSTELPLGAAVGRGSPNARSDVRLIQDRLFEIGVLAPAAYFSERVDRAAAGGVADATIPRTIAAIGRLQETLAGLAVTSPDFVVSAGGRSARVLARPAWSTPTVPNPNCALRSAGPARPTFTDVELTRIVTAIEAVEGGVSSGEIPAILGNASGTPASWGAAQVIGRTAVARVQAAANAAMADFYGLDAATLGRLQTIGDRTVALFDAVTGLVAANTHEADLVAQIQPYLAANMVTIRRETGLGPADVTRMFRAAQLRRHLVALGPAADEHVLLDASVNPDAAANINALELSVGDVGTYLRNPAFYGEHRQGFVTRALLLSPVGQTVRNLLTDDSGSKLGRLVIRDNWSSTPTTLPARDRAQLTAYLHNHGGNPTALAGQMTVVAADTYVTRVMARYDNP